MIQAMKTKFSILALVLMVGSLLAYADKEKKDEPQGSSEVKFQVVKADLSVETFRIGPHTPSIFPVRFWPEAALACSSSGSAAPPIRLRRRW